MRLSCPKCQTEYEIPDSALTGRARTLRCDACGNKWKAPALQSEPLRPLAEPEVLFGDEDEPALEDPEPSIEEPLMGDEAAEPGEVPEPEPAVKLSASRVAPAPPKPVPKKRRLGLGISILVVLLAIGAVLAAHRFIGQVWPPSLRLFDALGLR